MAVARVYFEDIFWFSNIRDKHIDHVWHVGTSLNDAQKMRNCKFFKNCKEYFGPIMRPWQLEVSLHTKNAILAYKDPLA